MGNSLSGLKVSRDLPKRLSLEPMAPSREGDVSAPMIRLVGGTTRGLQSSQYDGVGI